MRERKREEERERKKKGVRERKREGGREREKKKESLQAAIQDYDNESKIT